MLNCYLKSLCLSLFLVSTACSHSTLPTQDLSLTKGSVVEHCHEAHLSEGWYSKDPLKLNHELEFYLRLAAQDFSVEVAEDSVQALVVPHAGYYYSGLCAATAYQTLLPRHNNSVPFAKNERIKRVIILAPSHTHYFRGVALPDYTHYKTALGTLIVDQEACTKLAKHSLFAKRPDAHGKEHAIEMQLPFIQKTIADCSIIPLIIGALDKNILATIAAEISPLCDDQTLLIITSDFVHHGPSYNYTLFNATIAHQIRSIDSEAIAALMQKNLPAFNTYLDDSRATICGKNPLLLLLQMLSSNTFPNAQARLCSYYTSNHMVAARTPHGINTTLLYTSLDDALVRNGSVSYAGLVFVDQRKQVQTTLPCLTSYEQRALVSLARETLTNTLTATKQLPNYFLEPIATPALSSTCGAFVTLYKQHKALRGCIGHITTHEPLYKTISAMSIAAACNDTRFNPLQAEELADVSITVTVLAQPTPINSVNEIILGKHGIILNKKSQDGILTHSAVFLPSVPTTQGWDLTTTLQQLSLKAGLKNPDAWGDNCSFQVFESLEIKE